MNNEYEMITVANYVKALDEEQDVVIASVEEYLSKLAA